MRIALSVDVEGVPSEHMADSMRFLLDLLDVFAVKATFFFLGETAAQRPDLVISVHQSGHELAVHGYKHRSLITHNAMSLRKDLVQAKALMEDIAGERVLGYRAPFASLNARTIWAVDVIRECGFVYDSSCFSLPGGANACESQFDRAWVFDNGLIEIPIGTARLGPGLKWPLGGGFFRHLPYRLTRWLHQLVQLFRYLLVGCEQEGRQLRFVSKFCNEDGRKDR